MSFLPSNYERPITNSNYYKLQNGDNRFRILGSAIVGYEYWTPDKKPVRSHDKPTPTNDTPVRHFWAFPVWDYKSKNVKVCEITQATIQGAIEDLAHDENWGDPTGYDLIIKKTGEKMETEYSVVPVPPKPLHPDIAKLYAEANINLDVLFENGDPFGGKTTQTEPHNEPDNGEISVSEIPF